MNGVGAIGGASYGASGRAGWVGEARRKVREAMGGESRTGALAWVEVAAPCVALESALGALRAVTSDDGSEVLWAPGEGAAFVGRGAAARLDAGHGLEHLRDEGTALLARVVVGDRGDGGPAPRLFGALPFAAGAGDDEPWHAMGRATFVLPRVRYAVEGGRAWLAVALDHQAIAGGPRLLDEIDGMIDALAGAAEQYQAAPARPALRVEELPRARWTSLVNEILDGIAAGRFAKVVAARRTEVWGRTAFDALDVVARLDTPGCTRFLLRSGEAAFVGATPERLVGRRGLHVRTDALAGSTGEPGEAAARALLENSKERAEHDLVVQEIARRLGDRCAQLDVPATPRARPLKHLLHLHSPIEGVLRSPSHVLELAAALHPTPAVGGLPAAEALRWIAGREGAGRGLYAGPVGWFDAAGDGELWVGLRSALLRGERAWLWAGAGIVAGSDPEREYDETALKQRAMLAALSGSSC